MTPEAAFVTVAAIGAVSLIVKWSLGLAKETLTPPSVPEMPDMLDDAMPRERGYGLGPAGEEALDPRTQERVKRYTEYMEAANQLDRKANKDALGGYFLLEKQSRASADKLRERARKALDE